MVYNLKYSCYSERSILIEWPAIIDEIVLNDVIKFKNSILLYDFKQKVEVISTYNSILIVYEFVIENINDRILQLKQLFELQKNITILKSVLWEIPVCYDDHFGIDLNQFSQEKKLLKEEIIQLHSKTIYTLYFIGFLPGFIYLGGLDSRLHLERKKTPNLNIKKGSVAIGGQQTGIYPQDSPGGWHVIGKTPIALFNAYQNPPCFFKAGDKVQFKPVAKDEFEVIAELVAASKFDLKPVQIDA